MKFTINNNLRLLTCPLLLAGAVCCSSGNDGESMIIAAITYGLKLASL